MVKEEQKTIHVFWTGGWDSTFRILQLAQKNVIIQPYYLKDDRLSEQFELAAIDTITKLIEQLSSTRCTIKSLITEQVSDLEEDQAITQAYHRIRNDFMMLSDGNKLGSQYEWLAKFSKDIANLELGIEKGAKIIDIVTSFGGFERNFDKVKGAFYTVEKNSSEDLKMIFGNYDFPLILITKAEMKKIAEKEGYGHIMDETWFCHKPITEKPCGKCNPCVQTIEFGFEYRFTKDALQRYRIKKYLKILEEIIPFHIRFSIKQKFKSLLN
ncbi:7-cyano-7-deazaguanine synthase [Flavobacteriaceae bacterium M23B6Z8]